MTARFRKKVRRQRGSHTHGWGAKKKHRGGGSRGGRGMAGLLKTKKSKMLVECPDHFGNRGFVLHSSILRRTSVRAISLRDVDALAARTGKRDIDLGELGYQKLLGTGRATGKLNIRVEAATESAKAKVEEAGGKVVTEEAESEP